MKYYFKHLFRVIRKKPLQPILMLLILLFSFLVENTAISCTDAITQEEHLQSAEASGSAMVTVSVSSNSHTRFLTENMVKSAVPNAQVTGSYSLPYVMGEELVSGFALDFENANEFFTFSFIENESVEKSQKDEAIFITESFAKEHSLSLGDTLSLSLFGKDVTYTIKGISNKKFLGGGEVLTDISGVVNLLTGESEFLALFSDNINVYGTLYVKSETLSTSELLDTLSEALPDYSVTEADNSSAGITNYIFSGIAVMLILLCVIISLSVLVGCSYCMSKEREEFTSLFRLVGFPDKKAYFLRVIELLFYSIIAISLGCLLSYPLGNYFYKQMGLELATFSLTLKPMLISVGSLLFVCFVSPATANSKKKNPTKKPSYKLGLICLGSTVLLNILCAILPTQVKFYFGLVGITTFVLTLVFLSKPLLSLVASWGKKKANIPTRLAKKNCTHVGELTNSTRLLAILLCILLTVAYVVIATEMTIPIYEECISGTYLVAGGNSSVKEMLLSLEEVESVHTICVTDENYLENGRALRMWGIDSLDVFAFDFEDSRMPEVGEILSCTNMQMGYLIPTDEEFTVTCDGKTYTYKTSEVADGIFPMFITTNAEGVTGTDYYVVLQKDGVSDTELYSAISEALATQMVSILPVSQLMKQTTENSYKYLVFCRIVLAMLLVFGFVGIGNNLLESYRSRKEELNSFLICGMTKKQIRKMLVKEYVVILTLSLVVGIVGFLFLIPYVQNMTLPYAADILGVYKTFFKYIL